jgi:hypothetical protein
MDGKRPSEGGQERILINQHGLQASLVGNLIVEGTQTLFTIEPWMRRRKLLSTVPNDVGSADRRSCRVVCVSDEFGLLCSFAPPLALRRGLIFSFLVSREDVNIPHEKFAEWKREREKGILTPPPRFGNPLSTEEPISALGNRDGPFGSFRHHHSRPINIISNGAAGC